VTGYPLLPGESLADYARRTYPLHCRTQGVDPTVAAGQLERLAALFDTRDERAS
jgi:hypothetical protein